MRRGFLYFYNMLKPGLHCVKENELDKTNHILAWLFIVSSFLLLLVSFLPLFINVPEINTTWQAISGALVVPVGCMGVANSWTSIHCFDLDRNRFKNVNKIGPFTFGIKWKCTKPIEYISVFKQRYLQQDDSGDDYSYGYVLNLWCEGSTYHKIESLGNEKAALKLANKIAIQTGIPILDYTTTEPKWAIVTADITPQTP